MIANHPIYEGDWLSCDPLGWSHDSQAPHIRKHLCPQLVATLIYLSHNYSYHIRGDRSPLNIIIYNYRRSGLYSKRFIITRK